MIALPLRPKLSRPVSQEPEEGVQVNKTAVQTSPVDEELPSSTAEMYDQRVRLQKRNAELCCEEIAEYKVGSINSASSQETNYQAACLQNHMYSFLDTNTVDGSFPLRRQLYTRLSLCL